VPDQTVGLDSKAPAMTVRSWLSIIAVVVWGVLLWKDIVDLGDRQTKYIARDAAEFAVIMARIEALEAKDVTLDLWLTEQHGDRPKN